MFLNTYNHSKTISKIVYTYFFYNKKNERKLTLDLFQVVHI